ncbi:MAG: hypothetical protein HYY23_04855 [Verrucomicrobia bacterium]|nr:hypothetical protein [Verrucomicrobiota bacterium]
MPNAIPRDSPARPGAATQYRPLLRRRFPSFDYEDDDEDESIRAAGDDFGRY